MLRESVLTTTHKQMGPVGASAVFAARFGPLEVDSVQRLSGLMLV